MLGRPTETMPHLKSKLIVNIQIYLRAWIFFSAAATPDLSAEISVLAPDADTTLHQKFPDNNVGGHFDFAAGGVASGETTRALIRFSLDGAIPRGAQITAAKLTVRVTKAPSNGGSNSIFELRRVTRSWSEGTKSSASGEAATSGETTWNSRFHPDAAWSAGGGIGADFAGQVSAALEISGRTAYTFASTSNLVADAQFWLDNLQSNFGWVLMSRDEATPETARRFASREDAANAPTLTLEYTAGGAQLRISSLVMDQTNGVVTWQGGAPPFQLQHRASLMGGS